MESASKCLEVLQKHIAIWPVLKYKYKYTAMIFKRT